MILSNMAWRLRVRMLRLLQIDSKEKQELLYDGTAAPALWFNMLFLNNIGDSACRNEGINANFIFNKNSFQKLFQKSYKKLLTIASVRIILYTNESCDQLFVNAMEVF